MYPGLFKLNLSHIYICTVLKNTIKPVFNSEKNICGATPPKHKGRTSHLNTDSYCPSYVNKTQQC